MAIAAGFGPDSTTTPTDLGLLAALVGSWHGRGWRFTSWAERAGDGVRFGCSSTTESMTVAPIRAAASNRSFARPGAHLGGLTYLHRAVDEITGDSLRTEAGLWVTRPSVAPSKGTSVGASQPVARLCCAGRTAVSTLEGRVAPSAGPPVLPTAAGPYGFSVFPSFNTAPFLASGPLNSPGNPVAGAPGVGDQPLDLVRAETTVDEPMSLLQATVAKQVSDGYRFQGMAVNVASRHQLRFRARPRSDDTVTATATSAGSEAAADLLVEAAASAPADQAAASAPADQAAVPVLVYQTLWVERLTHADRQAFVQLQYAELLAVEMPGRPDVLLPQVSVATLRPAAT